MLKKIALFSLGLMLTLTACHSPVYDQSQANIADVAIDAKKAIQKSNNTAKPDPSLIVKEGDYVDTSPISLQRKPSWLRTKIIIRGDQLPFSYFSRTIAKGGGSYILTKYQDGLDSSTKTTLNYSGSIEGALDLLATKTGYVYTINGNSIYWQAFLTKTFDVAFMPGSTDYLMGKTSSGSGASSSSASSSTESLNFTTSDESSSEYSNLTGKLSLWDDLKDTITQLLSSEGKVTVSQATTSVTVKDRPMNVRLVGQYIKNLNRNLSKQVLVKIQILEVDLSSDYNYGINWGIVANAFHNSPFILNGNYGTPLAITALASQTAKFGATAAPAVPQMGLFGQTTSSTAGIPSYNILINALSQQGKTSIVSEPRVVCLNNQVSVIRITESEGYLASIENTTGVGDGTSSNNTVTSQVTPGTLVTGLTLYILPKILDNDVYMQVNADLSTNKGFEEFGPENSQIQLPKVTSKHFNQRSRIKSGDTLILSGFRQVKNNANASQLFKSQALGGKAATQDSVETVVLITPIVLHGSA